MATNRTRLLYALWLLCHDAQFWDRVRTFVRHTDFPPGPLRWLANLAIEHWGEHHRPLSEAIVALEAQDITPLDRTTPDEVKRVYRDLCDGFSLTEEERETVRPIAFDSLRLRRLGSRLDMAAQAVESGDPETARRALIDAGMDVRTPEPGLTLDHLPRVLSTPEPDPIPTGIIELDRAWKGGLHPGQLAMVLAPTGLGKSMFLCFLAARAWRANARVLYYTDELAASEVLMRIASAILKKPVRSVGPDQAMEAMHAVRNLRALDRAHIEVRFREAGSVTPADLRADLLASPFDMLIVDGDDMMRPRRRYDNRYMEYYDIYEGLRTFTEQEHVALWVSAQATRDAIDRAQTSLKYVGDSFWKARKAYFVLGLAQDRIEHKQDLPPMHVVVLKDSVYGSKGMRIVLQPTFGQGDSGWPGFVQYKKIWEHE